MLNRKRMMALTMSAMLSVTSGSMAAESAVHAAEVNTGSTEGEGEPKENSGAESVQNSENGTSDTDASEPGKETGSESSDGNSGDESPQSDDKKEDSAEKSEKDKALGLVVAALNGEEIDEDIEFSIDMNSLKAQLQQLQNSEEGAGDTTLLNNSGDDEDGSQNRQSGTEDADTSTGNSDTEKSNVTSTDPADAEAAVDAAIEAAAMSETNELIFTPGEDGKYASGDVQLNSFLDGLLDRGVTDLEAGADVTRFDAPFNLSELLGEGVSFPGRGEFVKTKLNGIDVYVRMQTDEDWMEDSVDDTNGEFWRYIVTDSDGTLLLTADEDGNINYEDSLDVYLDSYSGMLYSDMTGGVAFTGLRGMLISAGAEVETPEAFEKKDYLSDLKGIARIFAKEKTEDIEEGFSAELSGDSIFSSEGWNSSDTTDTIIIDQTDNSENKDQQNSGKTEGNTDTEDGRNSPEATEQNDQSESSQRTESAGENNTENSDNPEKSGSTESQAASEGSAGQDNNQNNSQNGSENINQNSGQDSAKGSGETGSSEAGNNTDTENSGSQNSGEDLGSDEGETTSQPDNTGDESQTGYNHELVTESLEEIAGQTDGSGTPESEQENKTDNSTDNTANTDSGNNSLNNTESPENTNTEESNENNADSPSDTETTDNNGNNTEPLKDESDSDIVQNDGETGSSENKTEALILQSEKTEHIPESVTLRMVDADEWSKTNTPSLADYVCVAEGDGEESVIYANRDGHLIYDASDRLEWRGDCFILKNISETLITNTQEETKDRENVENSDNPVNPQTELIIGNINNIADEYSDLGFASYPLPGEVLSFSVDGTVFAITQIDNGDRYICRSEDGETAFVVQNDGKLDYSGYEDISPEDRDNFLNSLQRLFASGNTDNNTADTSDENGAESILAEGRDALRRESGSETASKDNEKERLLADISSLEPVDNHIEEETDETDYEKAIAEQKERSREIEYAVKKGTMPLVNADNRPENLNDLLGGNPLPKEDDYTSITVALKDEVPAYESVTVSESLTDIPDGESGADTQASQDETNTETNAENNTEPLYREEKWIVRAQTKRDFAQLDEFGVWRDENGDIVEPDFVRYVGVNQYEKMVFTADKDGNITYVDDPGLYYNSEEKRFYSDEDMTVSFNGIQGLLDSAQLAMDGDTVLSLLSAVGGTSTTIEVPGEDVYPKRLTDKETGQELTEEEIKEKKISEDRINTEDPEPVKYLIWKVTDEDKEYAPEFASYICADEGGSVLFYADEEGHMMYDVSDKVIYGNKYFFTFDWEQEESERKDGKVVLRYGDLGFDRYPAAGETVYFSASGKEFSIERREDSIEGDKGVYICRRLDDPENYIVMEMDINGNICYAADGYEWRFVDYGIDYALLKQLMEEGENQADHTLDEIATPIDEAAETENESSDTVDSNPSAEDEIEEPDPEFLNGEEIEEEIEGWSEEDDDEDEVEEPDEDFLGEDYDEEVEAEYRRRKFIRDNESENGSNRETDIYGNQESPGETYDQESDNETDNSVDQRLNNENEIYGDPNSGAVFID